MSGVVVIWLRVYKTGIFGSSVLESVGYPTLFAVNGVLVEGTGFGLCSSVRHTLDTKLSIAIAESALNIHCCWKYETFMPVCEHHSRLARPKGRRPDFHVCLKH